MRGTRLGSNERPLVGEKLPAMSGKSVYIYFSTENVYNLCTSRLIRSFPPYKFSSKSGLPKK